MSNNPWINDEVPFEEYFADARAKAYAEAQDDVARTMSAFRMEPSPHNLAKTQAALDHLGPATPEQRAERKDSIGRKVLNAIVMTVVLIVTGLVLMGAGIYIGASAPDTWNDLPFVESTEAEEGKR